MNRRYLWGLAGLCSYVGAALLLAMAVSPLVDSGGPPDALPSVDTIGLLIASALLFGLGGICLRRAAGAEPIGGSGGATRDTTSRSVESGDGGPLTCAQCGTENERFYSYCESCAAKL